MESYRAQLAKIHEAGDRVPQRAFWSRPRSLRAAMKWMNYPRSGEWRQVQDINLTATTWTNLCQGVAAHGAYWVFSSNGAERSSQEKALYAFRSGGKLRDKDIAAKFNFDAELGDVGHIGQLLSFDGRLYVSQFNDTSSGAYVFELDDRGFRCVDHIVLEPAGDRVEFQAINPWTRQIYGTHGGNLVDRFLIYDLAGGAHVDVMPLSPGIDRSQVETGGPIQGACFSGNGHIFISSNHSNGKFQTIFYYSVLNGSRLGQIDVEAHWDPPGLLQELEGICCNGSRIFAVLLDKQLSAKDNIFFKCFAANDETLV